MGLVEVVIIRNEQVRLGVVDKVDFDSEDFRSATLGRRGLGTVNRLYLRQFRSYRVPPRLV